MKKLNLKIFCDKKTMPEFNVLPFEMPEGIEKMEVHYYLPMKMASAVNDGTEKNVINMAIIDEKGEDVGTRGSNCPYATISEYYSSDGYLRRKLNPGTWGIVIGIHEVKPQGVEVNVDITLYEKKAQWLAGDTHSHSTNSDGKKKINDLAKYAKKIGLDYLIYTDHNRIVEDRPAVEDLTPIFGVEMTYANGHANIWGVQKPYSGSYAINSYEEWMTKRDEAKANGAVVSINHPKCSRCPWLWTLEGDFYDCVEIWNGPMRMDNMTCIEWWDSQLKAGRKLPMVGGSDYHQDYLFPLLLGMPTTYVYSPSRSAEDILDAIYHGHSTITERVGGTFIELFSGDAIVGDSVKFDGNNEITVKAKGLKKGHTLYLFDNEGILYSHKAKKTGDFEATVKVRNKGFVRAEARYNVNKKLLRKIVYKIVIFFMIREEAFKKAGEFAYAVSNPIYFD